MMRISPQPIAKSGRSGIRPLASLAIIAMHIATARARVFLNAAGVKRSYTFKRSESRVLDAELLDRQLRLLGADGEEWRGCVVLRDEGRRFIEDLITALRARQDQYGNRRTRDVSLRTPRKNRRCRD